MLESNTFYYTDELFNGGDFWITKISGPKAFDLVSMFLRVEFIESTTPLLYDFLAPDSPNVFFKAKVIIFNAEDSITGEKLVEIHYSCNHKIKDEFCRYLSLSEGVSQGDVINLLMQRQKNDMSNVFVNKAAEILMNSESQQHKEEALYFLNTNFEEIYASWYVKLKELFDFLDKKADSLLGGEDLNLIKKVQKDIKDIYSQIESHMERIERFNEIQKQPSDKTKSNNINKSLRSVMDRMGFKLFDSANKVN